MNNKKENKLSIQKLINNIVSIVILILSISPVFSQKNNSPYIYVLGNVQDAGLPHIGCDEKICVDAFNDNKQHYVTSLALVDTKNNE